MKMFLKKILVAMVMMVSVFGVTGVLQPETAYAAPDAETSSGTENAANCRDFLGMKSWDCGIDEGWKNENVLISNIKLIATNIFNDMLVIAMYLALGFTIYGGYLYIFAGGDPAKVQNGKKTLTRAFIGVAITGLSKLIVDAMHIAFLGEAGQFENCAIENCLTNPSDLIGNALGWFIGTASVVAIIYVVVGGIGYLTSSGDPAKTQKSKNTILYALVGLIVAGLSQTIVSFVLNVVNKAEATGDFRDSLIEILNNVIGIIAVIAVIVVVIGGVRYMTSAGDPGKVKKARDTLIYAAIGLIVCALAAVIVNFVVAQIVAANKPDENQSVLMQNTVAMIEEGS